MRESLIRRSEGRRFAAGRLRGGAFFVWRGGMRSQGLGCAGWAELGLGEHPPARILALGDAGCRRDSQVSASPGADSGLGGCRVSERQPSLIHPPVRVLPPGDAGLRRDGQALYIPRRGFWLRGMQDCGETAKPLHPPVGLLPSGDAAHLPDPYDQIYLPP